MKPSRHTRIVSTHKVWVLGLAALASAAAADNGQGGFQVQPRLAIQGQYDSNIYLAPVKPIASLIVSFAPGLGLRWDGKRASLRFDYDFTFLHYFRFPTKNDAAHHAASVGGRYEFNEDGRIFLHDDFKSTTDPASSELSERTRRLQNDVVAGADIPVGPALFLGLDGTLTRHDYQKQALSDILDRDELLVGPRFGFRPGPKTKVYAAYRYQAVDYVVRDDADSTGGILAGGVEGDLLAKVAGSVEAGAAFRDYSRTVAGEPDRQATPYLKARVTWNAPRQIDLALTGARGYQEGVFTRAYINTLIGLTATKPLADEWTVGANILFSLDRYQGGERPLAPGGTPVLRRDAMVQGGVTVTYKLFEEKTLSGSILRRQRDSNFNAFDYTDDLVTASLTARF